jgi:outer membrane protein assembly factor BamB
MRSSRATICFIAKCAVLFFVISIPAVVAAADWLQWGGTDDRNMVSPEKGLPESFLPGNKRTDGSGIDLATTKNVKWVARLGSAAYGNPTVAQGRVFIGTDDLTVSDDPRFKRTRGGLVKCLEESTGRLLWQLVVPVRGNLPHKDCLFTHQHLGVCSSPTVEGDRLYVVSSAGEVLCMDVHGQANGNDGPFREEGRYMVPPDQPPIELQPTDGDILWRYDLLGELDVCPHDATSCSILIHGDLLYLSTSNGIDKSHEKMVCPDAPAFIALDKRTGRLAAFENDKLSRRLFHAQWCSPSLGKIGNKTLIFLGGGDGVCYAFEALKKVPKKPVGLKKVWSYDCNPPLYRSSDGKPAGYYASYYAGNKRKKNSPNKHDGLYVGPSDIIATPVFYKNRIYVAIGQDPAHGRGRGMFHCIDATKTGDVTQSGRLWTYDGLDRTMASAAIADGLVYVPDVAGRMHCLDAETGHCYWVHETKAETWGSPFVADGKVYFGNQKQFFIMAAGKEAKLLDEIHLGSPIYSTPIVANGVLYVASQQYLWAVEQQKQRTGMTGSQ